MAVKAVYKKYFQKSKVFLYPLLLIKKGAKYIPSETYLSLNDVIKPEDKKLICNYPVSKTDDYKLFVQTNDAGQVYLDFSTLGKSLQECYLDGLTPDYVGARVQNHYSANFVIQFESDSDPGFESWLNNHKISVATKGLGHIPLGYIVDTKARQSIEKCSTINKITISFFISCS